MANNEQIENLDFNKLVTLRAGSKVRKVREEYLAKVVKGLMIKRFGKGGQFPDEKILQVIKTVCEDDTRASWEIKDGLFPLYVAVAKAFLDDAEYDLFDMRLEAIEFLRQEEPRNFNFDRKISV